MPQNSVVQNLGLKVRGNFRVALYEFDCNAAAIINPLVNPYRSKRATADMLAIQEPIRAGERVI